MTAAFNRVPVVAVVGPTAVGKSAVADGVAFRLGSEVLSADAMQVYRGMDIGTAKMPACERRAPLRLIDIVSPSVAYSAALYQRDARREIDRVLARGVPPVMCGGTGLYVRAALDEMDFPSGELEDARRGGYMELADRLGAEGLHALLAERDPDSAACIHPNNVRRVVRALEMHDEGVSYAAQKEAFSTPRERYRARYFALTMDRERLYERINRRVDMMFEEGLLEEVEALCAEGLGEALTSSHAIGYKEIIDALEGRLTLSKASDLIKQRSRRYAKRQLSWFRRDGRMEWIDMDVTDVEGAIEHICRSLEE